MEQLDPSTVDREECNALVDRIRHHAIEHGWPSVAKAFRQVVSPHVGWDSDFTELDNVLRRIERDFEGSLTKDIDRAGRAHRSDILGVDLEDVSLGEIALVLEELDSES